MMTKYLKPRKGQSKLEWWWVFGFRVLGAGLFMIAFYLPAKSLVTEGKDVVSIGATRWIFIAIGFVLAFGGKNFGEWANSLGKKLISKK